MLEMCQNLDNFANAVICVFHSHALSWENIADLGCPKMHFGLGCPKMHFYLGCPKMHFDPG